MLPERYCELLTAYVDGELSARQRKLVLRLLHKSGEARQLLRQLQVDAAMVRDLPRRKLDADLSSRVLQHIADRGLQRGGPRPAAARSMGWPAWAGWVAAAAVLLSISALSYLSFPLFGGKDNRGKAVVHGPGDSSPQTDKPKKERPVPLPDRRGDRAVAKAPKEKEPGKVAAATDGRKGRDKALPKDRRKPRPIHREQDEGLGFPPGDDLPPLAQPAVSLMVPLHGLQEKGGTEKVRAKLTKDTAHRVELLCRDTGQALHQLRDIFARQGIRLVLDQRALARLKNPRIKTKFVIYGENLHPAELVAVLQDLDKADGQAVAKNKSAPQFSMLMVRSLYPAERRQISRFLGVPPRTKKTPGTATVPTPGAGPVGAQPKPPDKLKKGAPAPPSQTKPSPRPAERLALVLAYNENNSPVHPRIHMSSEVKQFRAHRLPFQPGTVQVILVLSRETA
jgi:hypothetical protein